MSQQQSDKDRDEGQETFANGEARFKLGDQWYYRGNRSPSWFYVASRPDGTCQGGIAERVPQHLWSFLEDTARTISGLKAMGQAVVNTIQQGMTPLPELGARQILKPKVLCEAPGDRCLGCAHYQGKADRCEHAATPPPTGETPRTDARWNELYDQGGNTITWFEVAELMRQFARPA